MTRNKIETASSITIIKGNTVNRKFLRGMFSLIMDLIAPGMIIYLNLFFNVYFYLELLNNPLNIETEVHQK